MNRVIRASVWSANVLVPTFYLVGLARSHDSVDLTFSTVFGMLIMGVFLWMCGAMLSFVLLLALRPIADRVARWISLLLFVTIGFSCSVFLEYEVLHVTAHGTPAPIHTEPWESLVFSMGLMAMIGMSCAFASWMSMVRSQQSDEDPLQNQ